MKIMAQLVRALLQMLQARHSVTRLIALVGVILLIALMLLLGSGCLFKAKDLYLQKDDTAAPADTEPVSIE